MAQARTPGKGGFTAVHVWMIGFVFLWLTMTVLLVWLYTDQERISSDLDSLRATNADLTRTRSELQTQLNDAALLAVGEETNDVEVIRTKIVEFLENVVTDRLVSDASAFESDALLPAASALYEEFRGEHERRVAAEDRAAAAETRLEELVAEHEALKTAFDSAGAELTGRVDDIESSRAAYAARRDGEVDEFERKMQTIRQESSRDIQDVRNQLKDEEQRRDVLEVRFAELKEKVGELQITPGELLTARSTDGEIVGTAPGDGIVYIDLGKRNQLTTGLQFAVYPETGIPADGRAKARIEVARIYEEIAECEILSIQPTEVILEGDKVANPVYDRRRALRFVVVGNFDVDGDGADDPFGADQIKALIRNWGGDVLDSISSRADFVVAGFAPVVPVSIGTDKNARDAGADERRRLLQRDLAAYDAAIQSAVELSIPVLTQDVFLRFLGY